jgi:hypothetical protein
VRDRNQRLRPISFGAFAASRYPEENAMALVFEWDNRKARTNLHKHGVSFVEAISVFNDPLARIFADDNRAIGEPREIVIGHSSSFRRAGEGARSHRQRTASHKKRAARL